MVGITVITGGGTGIGAALAKRIASRGKRVLIVGRRLDPLRSTQQENDMIGSVVADISTRTGREIVVTAVEESKCTHVAALVHNAGTLGPVKPMVELTLEEWQESMATNVEGPLFLTQALLPKLIMSVSQGEIPARVLHISSGASQNAYRGWGAYCTTKASLHMMYKVLALELKPKGIAVGSVRPGVVDTPMQDLVRSSNPDYFPDLSKFTDLKQEGKLQDPSRVAKFLDWLISETTPEEFSAKEWDIRDKDHQQRWANY